HAEYVLRPQPAFDERDVDVLNSHVDTLTHELEALTGLRLTRANRDTQPPAIQRRIQELNEELAEAYINVAGVPPEAHTPECAINQAPAYRPGPCDCGATSRVADSAQTAGSS